MGIFPFRKVCLSVSPTLSQASSSLWPPVPNWNPLYPPEHMWKIQSKVSPGQTEGDANPDALSHVPSIPATQKEKEGPPISKLVAEFQAREREMYEVSRPFVD